MKSIEQIQNEIIEDFSLFEDWMEKYEYIIDLGKNLSPVEENLKNEEFLIPGCQSRVWLIPEFKNNKLHLLADSDAIITKGIISMLVKVFNGRTPEEIKNSDLFFIEKIGLGENLSPTRANGLAAMTKKIYHYADVFSK
ncbi:MAG: SufE family protein [Bacteroidota bacterium]|nr:SufE family protein [Bacteroidota bacterium]